MMNLSTIKERLDERSATPQYRQLAEIIVDQIRSNKLNVGQRLPAQREFMSKLGLSDSTVCRAMRDLTMRGVLHSRRGQGTFVSDRGQATATSVAVLVPAHHDAPYDSDIMWNIENVAHRAGYDAVFCNTEDSLSKSDSYLDKLLRNKPAGVIYVPVAMGQRYYRENILRIRRLQDAGIKVVLCDRNFLNEPDAIAAFELDCVFSDDINGSRELVNHLLENGRKKIALVSSPMDSNVQNRIIGYRRALEDKNIHYRSELVKFVEDYDSKEDVSVVIDELLKLPSRPDAIYAINDRMAEVVMAGLADKGISVPQEIAVVGYDNRETGQYLEPSLTTVDRDNAEIGQVAMELLLEQIEGKRTTPRHVALPTKLIVRESSGNVRDKVTMVS